MNVQVATFGQPYPGDQLFIQVPKEVLEMFAIVENKFSISAMGRMLD